MADGRETARLETFRPDESRTIDDYREFIGDERVDELKRLAEPLAGKGWANVNSTMAGGGVAEMLKSVIPLARGLGIQADWHVIRGNDRFFDVTKKFHNMLQGMDLSISMEEIFEAYLGTIDENAKNTFIASDLVIIHDPQPVALAMNGVIFGNVLWRCHIDNAVEISSPLYQSLRRRYFYAARVRTPRPSDSHLSDYPLHRSLEPQKSCVLGPGGHGCSRSDLQRPRHRSWAADCGCSIPLRSPQKSGNGS